MDIRNVKFSRTSAGITLKGTTAPNARVTAENASAAPFGSSTQKDIYASVKADATGHFTVQIPMGMEGDKVNLRVQGKASGSVMSVRLKQAGVVDGRRAEVGHQGLRLVDDGKRGFRFTNVRRQKKLGEPGAQFELVNQRSRERTAFVLDSRGRLPNDARLPGKAGDVFKLHVSDGVHNEYMSDRWSALVAPPAAGPRGVVEPVLTEKSRRSASTTIRLTGPLFKDGASPKDAVQGQLGDCYMVSAAAGIAVNHPERLRRLVKDNANGTVTVTFKTYDSHKKRYVDHPVTVTREVPAQYGKAVYGSDDEATDPAKMECWFPMLEKAYAAWKGGYDAIECGYPYEMFEALLGTEGTHVDTRAVSADSLWKTLRDAVTNKQASVVWTGQENDQRRFTNSGMYGDHAYTLMGITETGGKRMVSMRNPWGHGEPTGNGADDGVFAVSLEVFQRLFVGVGVAN